ncbi:MAG: carotenoid biosynthesis protein [Dehalococcoidia bacterium]
MEVLALLTERPYVVAFLVTFLVVAWAERGWQRTLGWLASGTFLGWLMEFSSTHTGFPFGAYSYHEELFTNELWIGGVPVFASLSFAFLTYFGYSVACTLLSRLELHGGDIQRVSDPRIEASLKVLLLAAIITTWVDTVIDPVTHLGRYWFLGDLYSYNSGGIHFDVPVSNYAGWLLTCVCVIFVNQRFDVWLRSRAGPERGFYLPYKPFWALGSIFGDFAFMLGVTIYLMTAADVPSTVPLGGILASGLVLSGVFTLGVGAVIAWRLAMSGKPTRQVTLANVIAR